VSASQQKDSAEKFSNMQLNTESEKDIRESSFPKKNLTINDESIDLNSQSHPLTAASNKSKVGGGETSFTMPTG